MPKQPKNVRPLANYRSAPLYNILCSHAESWSTDHGLLSSLDQDLVKKTKLLQKIKSAAATFSYFCSPKNTSTETLCHITELLAVFFFLDDAADATQMTTSEWASFHEELTSVINHGQRPIQYHNGTSSWATSFFANNRGLLSIESQLRASLSDYCLSLDEERAANRDTLTPEEYWKIRLNTGFIDPYILVLQYILDLESIQALAPLRKATIELVCMANDIGSHVKDQEEGQDLNLVLVMAATSRMSATAAAGQLLSDYNRLAGDYQELVDEVRSSHRPNAIRLTDLFAVIVNGNLSATRALSERYRGADSLLQNARYIQ